MKVCLVSPLLQHIYLLGDISAKYPPLGLGYIASVLEKGGHEVKIIERKLFINYSSNRQQYLVEADRKTKDELLLFDPEIVGITSTTPAVMDAFRVAKLIKGLNRKILTIIGGAHPGITAEHTLSQCNDIDIVCRGDGEFVMLEMANGVERRHIKGISYKNGGGIISNEDRDSFEDLDRLPYPARHLFDTKFYFSEGVAVMRGTMMRAATIFTARGCPFKCAFCLSTHLAQLTNGKYVRFHSPEYIADEIEFLIDKYGINAVNILDDMFAVNKKRAISICEMFIKRGLDKRIKYNVNLRADSVDEDLLQILKRSGCINVVYGCESGSEHTLKLMKKNTTVAKNMEAIEATKRAGITCDVNILIGMPEETEQDIVDTIRFLKKSRPDKIRVSKLYPLPGTAVFTDLVRAGVMRKDYDNWDEIGERYDINEVTFSDMPYSRFLCLWNKLNREIVLPTNYMFAVRANFNSSRMYAIRNLVLMLLHLSFLYLPLGIQGYIKKFAQKLSYKLRFLFR